MRVKTSVKITEFTMFGSNGCVLLTVVVIFAVIHLWQFISYQVTDTGN